MIKNKVFGEKAQDLSDFGPASPYKIKIHAEIDLSRIAIYLVESIKFGYKFKPAGYKVAKNDFSIQVFELDSDGHPVEKLFQRLETKSIREAKKIFKNFQY